MNRSSQREAILKALRSVKSHPTADEIYAMVHDSMPRLSLATVYRNLEQLVNAGMVTAIDGAGSRRFDGNAAPHHHKRCSVCGSVSDIFSEELHHLDNANERLLPLLECSACSVEFSGICGKCRAAETPFYETVSVRTERGRVNTKNEEICYHE